jgi:hypothetical protein
VFSFCKSKQKRVWPVLLPPLRSSSNKKLCSYANKNLFLQCVVSYVRSPSVEINGRGPTKRINFCNEPHTQEGKEANWKWNKKWIRVDCIVQERPCNKTTLTLSHRNSHQMLQQMIILHLDWILLTLSLSLSLYNHFALKWTSWPRDHSKRENHLIRDTLRGFSVVGLQIYMHRACRSKPSSKISHLEHSRVKINAKNSLSLG